MAKYVCPICGKIWYNTSDLAKCVSACDKAAVETAAKKAAQLRQKSTDEAKLKKLRTTVDEAYSALRKAVNEYNAAATEYSSLYGEKVATCASTFTWKDTRVTTDTNTGRYPWGDKNKLEELRKAYAATKDDFDTLISKDDLNKLINDIFNF